MDDCVWISCKWKCSKANFSCICLLLDIQYVWSASQFPNTCRDIIYIISKVAILMWCGVLKESLQSELRVHSDLPLFNLVLINIFSYALSTEAHNCLQLFQNTARSFFTGTKWRQHIHFILCPCKLCCTQICKKAGIFECIEHKTLLSWGGTRNVRMWECWKQPLESLL